MAESLAWAKAFERLINSPSIVTALNRLALEN